jgi:hypothetical protein
LDEESAPRLVKTTPKANGSRSQQKLIAKLGVENFVLRSTSTAAAPGELSDVGSASLWSDVGQKEFGHEVEGFGGFGEFEVVPEGVGQSFEDDELRVNLGMQKGAME